MTQTLTLRRALLSDLSAVDRLLNRSYPRLLARDYPPSALVLAIPRYARAQPSLLQSGHYFVVEQSGGRVLAAGGWSRRSPSGATEAAGTVGHVRHVATDPDAVRQGLGRMLMQEVMADAARTGMRRMDCLSTRTAVPFYAALGFRSLGETVVPLGPGIAFPVVRMLADLAAE